MLMLTNEVINAQLYHLQKKHNLNVISYTNFNR